MYDGDIDSKDVQTGESMDRICNYCAAKKWHDDAPGIRCAGGEVSLL